jgi:hypothetical protein
MDIQFQHNATVKAIGSEFQAGHQRWYMVPDQRRKVHWILRFWLLGRIWLEELTSSKMKLKSKMPVNGVEQETIMVFQPVIK